MDRACRTVAVISSLAMTGTILLGGCGGGSTAATAPTPGVSASSATPAPETMAAASSSAEVPLAGPTSAQPSSVTSSPTSGSPEVLEPAGIEAKGTVAGSGRILVVDDSRAVRLIGCRMLTSLGYQCFEASDGEEGLEKAEQETFAAMLVDWDMSNVGGLEMLKQLRTRGDRTKVIIMTSETGMSAILDAARAGTDLYLVKPFTIEALDDSLRAPDFAYPSGS